MHEEDVKQDGVGLPEEDVLAKQNGLGVPEEDVVWKQDGTVKLGS